jgi:photosystem II stability/assembly factor-like uncharacterized protein
MSVVVIVGTSKGGAILRSSPARNSWEFEGLSLPGWLVTAATRDSGGRYYLAVSSDVFGAAIMVSDDLQSWRQIENGPKYEASDVGNEEHNRIIRSSDFLGRYQGTNRHLDQIWKLHAAGDVVYAGVSEAGLFRSQDRGESWEPVLGFNDHPTRSTWMPGFGGLCLHTILTDRRDPDRIWCGVSSSGAFRSEDGGKSWTGANAGVSEGPDGGFCVHSMANDPNDADVIYRQDHRGVYRSRDSGDSWEVIENGLPVGPLSDSHECSFGFPIAVDPGSDSAYVIPLEGDSYRFPREGKLRVYRTRDHGDHWEPLSKGLPEGHTYTSILRGAMATDGMDPCGVYFGTSAGTVYATRDGGDTWTQLPCTLPRILSVEAFEV